MLIFGHRGAADAAPENTIAAVMEGLNQGADGIEVDVRLSSDRKMMVVHDSTYKRTTGYTGYVSKTSSARAKSLDAGSYKEGRFTGEKIPLLSELLDAVPTGKLLQIELKSRTNTVASLIKEIKSSHKDLSELIVIGFNAEALSAFKEQMPKVKVAWINGHKSASMTKIQRTSSIIRICKLYKFDAIDFDCSLPIDEEYVFTLKNAGIGMYSWTVDSPDLAKKFRDYGVDGITSNMPGRMRQSIIENMSK